MPNRVHLKLFHVLRENIVFFTFYNYSKCMLLLYTYFFFYFMYISKRVFFTLLPMYLCVVLFLLIILSKQFSTHWPAVITIDMHLNPELQTLKVTSCNHLKFPWSIKSMKDDFSWWSLLKAIARLILDSLKTRDWYSLMFHSCKIPTKVGKKLTSIDNCSILEKWNDLQSSVPVSQYLSGRGFDRRRN